MLIFLDFHKYSYMGFLFFWDICDVIDYFRFKFYFVFSTDGEFDVIQFRLCLPNVDANKVGVVAVFGFIATLPIFGVLVILGGHQRPPPWPRVSPLIFGAAFGGDRVSTIWLVLLSVVSIGVALLVLIYLVEVGSSNAFLLSFVV